MPIVKVDGPPFELPIAQSAEAKAVDTSVELTFRVIWGGEPHPVPVRIRMTPEIARALASQIVPCAVTAEVSAKLQR